MVLVTDENLLPPARYLRQRLLSLNSRDDTDVILVAPPGTEAAQGSITLSISDLGLPQIDFKVNSHITPAAYYRIAVPRALAGRYRRMLYLDIDVLVTSAAVFNIFDADMHGAAIAAVRDMGANFSPKWFIDGHVHDGEFRFERYFNSGVLLIDVEQFITEDIDTKAYEIYREHGPLHWNDQTALNLACPNWSEMSPAMNMWVLMLDTHVADSFAPLIIHYHGSRKPWHWPAAPRCRHALRRELVRSLALAAPGFLLRHFNAKQVVRLAASEVLEWLKITRLENNPYYNIPKFITTPRLMSYLEETAFIDRALPPRHASRTRVEIAGPSSG